MKSRSVRTPTAAAAAAARAPQNALRWLRLARCNGRFIGHGAAIAPTAPTSPATNNGDRSLSPLRIADAAIIRYRRRDNQSVTTIAAEATVVWTTIRRQSNAPLGGDACLKHQLLLRLQLLLQPSDLRRLGVNGAVEGHLCLNVRLLRNDATDKIGLCSLRRLLRACQIGVVLCYCSIYEQHCLC